VALVGLPPFGLFVSEFIIFRAGLERHAWVAAIGIALLVVVFAGMLAGVNQMLYGEPPDTLVGGEVPSWSMAPLAVNFALLIAFGLTLPSVVADVVKQAIEVLGG
jgi:hydrogenase-4 component F